MDWYRVVKTINGHRYLYEQRTRREGKQVRTESRYIGPADANISGQSNTLLGTQIASDTTQRAVEQQLIQQGYTPELAEFIACNRAGMMDMKSPGKSINYTEYTRLEGNELIKVYRVSSKGKGIEDGKFVFTSKEKALEFREDYGYKRGQPELIERLVKKSDLLKPNDFHSEDEYVYNPKSSQTEISTAQKPSR